MAKNPETLLTDRISRWLKKQEDIYFFKVHGGTFGRVGIPDIAGTVGGLAFFIEVKTETGRVSAKQQYEMDRIAATGTAVTVARSTAEVIDFVENLRAGSSRLG